MKDDPKSLLQMIKYHWLYAVVFVVVASAGATYMTVKALIIDVLQDHARRQAQEIADLRAAQPSRAGAPRGPARFVEEQHIIRTYEWQWAGENWYGRLTLANQNGKNVVSSLRIGELRKKYSGAGGMFHIGPRLVELVEGSFELQADHRLKLDLTVDKTVIGHHPCSPDDHGLSRSQAMFRGQGGRLRLRGQDALFGRHDSH